VETAIKREGFSEAQQAVLHNEGPETEIAYRLAWARTYLKGMGLLTNSSRGVWALTDEGTALLTDPSSTDHQRKERIQELRARYLTDLREARKARPPQENGEPDDEQTPADRNWKEQLLEQLMGMAPDAFERLAHGRAAWRRLDLGRAGSLELERSLLAAEEEVARERPVLLEPPLEARIAELSLEREPDLVALD